MSGTVSAKFAFRFLTPLPLQHPPGPVVSERVAVGHRAAGRVGRRAVGPAQQLTGQIVGKRAGIPLLVGLHPDSPGRVVTELDDPIACRPHRRAAGVVRIGLPDLLTPCVVIIQGHLVLGIGQRRNLNCDSFKKIIRINDFCLLIFRVNRHKELPCSEFFLRLSNYFLAEALKARDSIATKNNHMAFFTVEALFDLGISDANDATPV